MTAKADRNRETINRALRRPPEDKPGTLDDAAARARLDEGLIAMRADEHKAPVPLPNTAEER